MTRLGVVDTMRTRTRLLVAWGVGGAIYLIAVALWSYDGILSLVFQPLCAAVVSAMAVGLVLIPGLVLRVPPLGRLWNAQRTCALVLVVGCLAVMGLGSSIGLTGSFEDPQTHRSFVALHPVAALLSYLLLLFVLAHWPARPPSPILARPLDASPP
jgi:uncharacterized membrane protein